MKRKLALLAALAMCTSAVPITAAAEIDSPLIASYSAGISPAVLAALPKTAAELEAFIAANGNIFIFGKYMAYCNKVEEGDDYVVDMYQTGTAEIKEIYSYKVDSDTYNGSGIIQRYEVHIYEAVSAGPVKITFSHNMKSPEIIERSDTPDMEAVSEVSIDPKSLSVVEGASEFDVTNTLLLPRAKDTVKSSDIYKINDDLTIVRMRDSKEGYVTAELAEAIPGLPKFEDEFDEFIEKNGKVSVAGNYIIYCGMENASTGYKNFIEQEGTAEIEEVTSYDILDDNIDVFYIGGSTCVVYIYKPVSAGSVKVSFAKGAPWNLEKTKKIDETETFEIAEDMTVVKTSKALSVGDIDGNGIIDASDASSVLAAYAAVQSGGKSELDEKQLKAADVDGNDVVDASDASSILAYYSFVQTGGAAMTFEEFLNQ